MTNQLDEVLEEEEESSDCEEFDSLEDPSEESEPEPLQLLLLPLLLSE